MKPCESMNGVLWERAPARECPLTFIIRGVALDS